MTAAYPIRPISEAEFPEFYAVIEHAFNATYPADAEMQHDRAVLEFDRTLAAFDGGDLVGTAAAVTFQMTVPGDVAGVAGVTAVSVLPSHRRRGILSSLMHRQLADVRDRGEALAALFASEAGIYGRFGYGAATVELDVTVRRGEGMMSAQAAAGGQGGARGPRLRIAEPGRATAELATVFDSVQRARPGMPARDGRWWDYVLWDPEHRRSGSSPLRCMIADDDAGVRGYALFSGKPHWDDHGIPSGVLQVRELMATDPVAYAALWNDLLSRDLVSEVRARVRPIDEPLLYLLADRRRTRPLIADGLWIRLVRLDEALTRRRYSRGLDVVIEVVDDLFAQNAGRWRLRAPDPASEGGPGAPGDPLAPARASCERTSAPADLILPVQALGAAYLGGTRLGALAAAGLVTEMRPGALGALSAAMSWDPAPWCPTGF
jgi:predicted acetyltransferase